MTKEARGAGAVAWQRGSAGYSRECVQSRLLSRLRYFWAIGQAATILKEGWPAAPFVARHLLYIWPRGNRAPEVPSDISWRRECDRIHEEDTVINLILWLLFGALVGWLASIVMRTDAQQGALLNIVVGIIGAMIGGFLLGGPTINSNTFNLTALVVSFIGAVVLLAIVNLVRRGSIR
jgi:uncharacterized membrane protein YeaQ/YmgE (transglycosylase-associated protein family)